MLNHGEGEELRLDGEGCIRATGSGQTHLLFGPYVSLAAGRYLAEFWIADVPGQTVQDDRLCAILDVVADDGRRILAHEFVFASQLTGRLQRFQVAFTLDEPADRVEYRLRARADAPVIAADNASSRRSDDAAPEPASLAPRCSLVRDDPGEIVDLFKRGYLVARADDGLRFGIDGIVVAAEERDDLNFLGEVFEHRAYHVEVDADQCVVDIGMNVGLTSLLFASRDRVKEVHSFEPFPSTYAKAQKNLALNAAFSGKIQARNLGLSDHDGDETVLVPDTSDSGSRATISVEGGRPVALTLRDAATTLKPIIAAARARGRQVILKVDCEGSEFAIFDSLGRAGLFAEVDTLMVEWHAMFAGKTAATLTAPLLQAGFTVIDLSPRQGNGFFYAIRNREPRPRRSRSTSRRVVRWLRRRL